MATNDRFNPAFEMDDREDQNVVTRQPRTTRGTYSYDDESSQRITNLSQAHKRPKRLKQAVDDTTRYVTHATEERRKKLRSGMAYDQFMAGLLYADETKLLRGRFLYYEKIEFEYDEAEVKKKKKTMKEGRAFLTNYRLILLSNEELQANHFSGVKKEKPVKKTKKERKKEEEEEASLVGATDDLKTVDLTGLYLDMNERKPYVIDPTLPKSKYYGIYGNAKDLVSYFSIPLGCIKNVEFDADIGATAITILKRKKPCCCCRPFGFCGVHIHIKPEQEIEIVRDIIVDLQHYTPDLYTGKMEYRG